MSCIFVSVKMSNIQAFLFNILLIFRPGSIKAKYDVFFDTLLIISTPDGVDSIIDYIANVTFPRLEGEAVLYGQPADVSEEDVNKLHEESTFLLLCNIECLTSIEATLQRVT